MTDPIPEVVPRAPVPFTEQHWPTQLSVSSILSTAATLVTERGWRSCDPCRLAHDRTPGNPPPPPPACPPTPGGALCVLCALDTAVRLRIGVPSPTLPGAGARAREARHAGTAAKQLLLETMTATPAPPGTTPADHERSLLTHLALTIRIGRYRKDTAPS